MRAYIVSPRLEETDPITGGLLYGGPLIDRGLYDFYRDHSRQIPKVMAVNMAVFDVQFPDENLAAIEANPDVHLWNGAPQGLADFLTVKGVSKEQFDAQILDFTYDHPDFVAALQAVSDLL